MDKTNEMHKILLLFVFLPCVIFAQRNNSSHEINIDFFNPLKIPGQDKYFNDSWLLDSYGYGGDENHPIKRKYTRIGIGLEYTLRMKKNYLLNFDFGFGYRKIQERLSYYVPNPVNHPDEVMQGATELNYQQKNYGLSVYFGKSIELNDFCISLAIGPSYLLQGVGNQELFNWSTENVYPNIPADSIVYDTKSKFGIGHNFGLGMKISTQYYFGKRFSIGCDFSWHLFYSIYNKPNNHETDYYLRKSYDGITSQETIENYKSEEFTEFKQLSFTNISPSLKLTYVLK